MSASKALPEDVRKRIEGAIKQGKLVVLHPNATKIIKRTDRVEPIDYPKAPPKSA